MRVCLLFIILTSTTTPVIFARPNLFNLDLGSFFSFPAVRRGRATASTTLPLENSDSASSVTVSKNSGEDANVIAKLIESVMQEVTAGEARSADGVPVIEDEYYVPVEVQNQPRNVAQMKDFGPRLAAEYDEIEDPIMDLQNLGASSFRQNFVRQNDPNVEEENSNNANDDDEIRCIPKVMQVEETVYDKAIKCHHSYQEKCHMTYITDYRTISEEKCTTTYKKNCQIEFKAMPFNETVRICHNPLVRTCNDSIVGPEICNTHYETSCETTYKSYEIEQDEPVCTMEVMKKCEDVTIQLPEDAVNGRLGRQDNDDGESTTDASVGDATAQPGNTITVDQKCEEWPVQKCTLEKRKVKKVHPETACNKIPKEVCAPNNCELRTGEEVCRDENRVQMQNVPEEECDIQPEEQCHMEATLVPRLVPKPNCVKVPKEICVNSKVNPRVVKKPVIKEWCYRPSDLAQTPGVTVPSPTVDQVRRNFYN